MLGFGSMLLTALAFVGLIVHAVRREVRAIVGSTALFLGSLMLLLWVTFSVELVGTKWPYATVYSSKRSVYYVLCDALVPTDTPVASGFRFGDPGLFRGWFSYLESSSDPQR